MNNALHELFEIEEKPSGSKSRRTNTYVLVLYYKFAEKNPMHTDYEYAASVKEGEKILVLEMLCNHNHNIHNKQIRS